jgi:hypothetical protein
MKQFIFSATLLFSILSVNAQSYQMEDTFDTNSNGWTEVVSKRGEAIIKDGVLRIKSKAELEFFASTCYTDIDVQQNFEMKCEIKVKSINDDSAFGMILDYIDDGNFIAFVVFEGNARLVRYQENELIGFRENNIKLKSARKASVDLTVKSTHQRLVFEINGMTAIEVRYLPLTSNGIGFYVAGKNTVDFDNLIITQ